MNLMTPFQIRQEFLIFFKRRGHKIMPSSSLIPSDLTVLFTTAGMQQFSSYLSGERDTLAEFNTRCLASAQKCLRTDDIEKVGDDIHHTFFEMLGNWSIGRDSENGYFKEGAINFALEFFVDKLGLDKDKFWVTIFKGGKGIPKDKKAVELWGKNGILKERIKEFGIEDNFWGPVGKAGPCGPCSEIHYDRGIDYGCKDKNCGPNCLKCNRFIELWNLVFMEYYKDEKGNYKKLFQTNIDTGIGFERLVSIIEAKDSAYETDLFKPIIKEIENLSKEKYENRKREFRIIADHIRSIVFLIADKVLPSNLERGYVLRKMLRRAIRCGKLLNLPKNFLISLAQKSVEIYYSVYPEIKAKEIDVLTIIQKEEEKFEKTLDKGLKQFEKIILKGNISGEQSFHLYDTYGFPLELTQEMAKERGLKVNKADFEIAFKKHQEISRAGLEKKFGGVGIEKLKKKKEKIKVIKLHTATHLLHQALREILGEHIRQMGSDITSERLRFDFSHFSKMSQQEIRKVEEMVNQKIKENLEVKKEELGYDEALKSGALAFFKEKYPAKVTVCSIGDPSAGSGQVFSKEICAGPHVSKTSELGLFKIVKEESSGAGIRRIRAILCL